MTDNALIIKILEIITPVCGELMARSTISVHCEKTGIRPENLSAQHLPLLAQRIQALLQIFVGSDKAREIADKVGKLACEKTPS